MNRPSSKALEYQRHLDRVSRSFAFCIEKLHSPLRDHVGLAYLLCRILDTVEDSEWGDPTIQDKMYLAFEEFLISPVEDHKILNWVSQFPPTVPSGEGTLLQDAVLLFTDFHQLSPEIRSSLQDPILSMCRGMRFFSHRRHAGNLRLKTLAEVNQYCFFVAGVVGEILTRLASHEKMDIKMSQGLLTDAFHFGLFLQKINLLKDQIQDEDAGRFLIHSRLEVAASLRENSRRALDYITALPEKFTGYRLFCSWSLFLGLASLPWIERSWQERQLIKIPRLRTRLLLARVERIIGCNKELERLFARLTKPLNEPQLQLSVASRPNLAESTEVPVADLYRGQLKTSQFKLLGLRP